MIYSKYIFIFVSALFTLLIIPGVTLSEIPKTMNYQGYLIDKSTQEPITDPSLKVTFFIYDSKTEGNLLWSQTQHIEVHNGFYNVILGGGAFPKPINLPFDEQYYLGIKVGDDPEMTPRQMLASAPYALNHQSTKHCWDMLITENQDGPITPAGFLLQMALTHTLEDFYTVQGIIADTGPEDRPVIFSGSAVSYGNELYINFTLSQEHADCPWRDTGVGQIRIDKDTMDGNIWGTRIDFDTTSWAIDNEIYFSGTVSSTSCPTND